MKRNWIIGAAVAGGAFVFNSVMTADRDSTGAIVSEGSVDAFQMRVGDCFDDGSAFASEEVNSVPGVPCSNPHDNEMTDKNLAERLMWLQRQLKRQCEGEQSPWSPRRISPNCSCV